MNDCTLGLPLRGESYDPLLVKSQTLTGIVIGPETTNLEVGSGGTYTFMFYASDSERLHIDTRAA